MEKLTNESREATTGPDQGAAVFPLERPDLLRAEDVARRLQVGRSMVYDLIRSGTLRSVKVGRCRRVTLAAYAEYLAWLDGQEPAA